MENKPLNILLVDTHISNASKIKVFLENSSEIRFQVLHCNSRGEAVRLLKERKIVVDVIVLDLFLIDPINPRATYKMISHTAGHVPIVVITGKQGHSLALDVTKHGASDIVIRERFEAYPKRLLDAIEFSLIREKLLCEMKEKSAAEVHEHKRMLHWMMGGYSTEAQSEPESILKEPESKKGSGSI